MLGIIGGIAPSSTIEYYRRLIDGFRATATDANFPRFLVNNINLRPMLDMMEEGDEAGTVAYLTQELHRLADGGATIALFASNTPHLYFRQLQRASPLPLISIVEATRDVCVQRGLRRVAILGTRFTMDGGYYDSSFADVGIEVVAPSRADIDRIHAQYMNELVHSVYTPQLRAFIYEVVDRIRETDDIDGVLLAGTELPILLQAAEYRGLPLLDTTQIHVDRALSLMPR